MAYIVAFLGNPGKRYSMSRHNFGWMVCDRFLYGTGTTWTEKFNGTYTAIGTGDEKVYLIKPGTFMNECGRSIAAIVRFFDISPADLVVVHDDLELPYGRIEEKTGGGTAGHNGLRSIKTHLGTVEFRRLRLGIGRPERIPVSSYVLSRFSPDEEAMLPALCDRASGMLGDMLNRR